MDREEGIPFSWAAIAKWALNALLGVVVWIVLTQVRDLSLRLDRANAELHEQSNRVTTLEAVYPDIHSRLRRIEDKIDKLQEK